MSGLNYDWKDKTPPETSPPHISVQDLEGAGEGHSLPCWDPCCCSPDAGGVQAMCPGQVLSYMPVVRVSWGESHPPAPRTISSDGVGTEVNIQDEAPPSSCSPELLWAARWETLSTGKTPRCVQGLIVAILGKKGHRTMVFLLCSAAEHLLWELL